MSVMLLSYRRRCITKSFSDDVLYCSEHMNYCLCQGPGVINVPWPERLAEILFL